jgi:hypothetical protein
MIKKTIKPIVLDKSKHLIDLNNWSFKETSFHSLEYEGDDNYDLYSDEWVTYYVEGFGDIDVMFEVEHSWVSEYDSGDWDTPPSLDIVHEDIDVYVLDLGCEKDLNLEERVMDDLMYRLSYLIKDTIIS